MDKRFIYISLFLGLVTMSAFYSCNSSKVEVELLDTPAEQGYDTAKFEGLKEYFVADTIPNQNLMAFEYRAMIQLQDYANLVEMITNREVKKKFRKRGAIMIEGLFANNEVLIEDYNEKSANNKKIKLKKYLKILTKSKRHIKLDLTELKIDDHLRWVDDNLYLGNITFKQTAYSINEGSAVSNEVTHKNAEIIVQMIEKEFGDQKENVWSVRLGNIALVDLLVGGPMGTVLGAI